jgi:hypothetical protein
MSEEKKKPVRPEIFFLPPLKMVLSFFDRKSEKKKDAQPRDESKEQDVKRIINRLNDNDKTPN